MARKSRKSEAKPTRTVFYLAMEGSVTERKYFDAIIKNYGLRNVYLLRKSRTRSSPSDVIKRLEQQMRKRKDDHSAILEEYYWAVFDTDLRPMETLRQVASRAASKEIQLAASNPCFEIWLLMHFGYLKQLSGLEGSAAIGGCKAVTDYLKRLFDQKFDKSAFNPSKYIEQIDAAVNNANASDSDDDTAWMTTVGSRVYRLVEMLRDYPSSPNNPRH